MIEKIEILLGQIIELCDVAGGQRAVDDTASGEVRRLAALPGLVGQLNDLVEQSGPACADAVVERMSSLGSPRPLIRLALRLDGLLGHAVAASCRAVGSMDFFEDSLSENIKASVAKQPQLSTPALISIVWHGDAERVSNAMIRSAVVQPDIQARLYGRALGEIRLRPLLASLPNLCMDIAKSVAWWMPTGRRSQILGRSISQDNQSDGLLDVVIDQGGVMLRSSQPQRPPIADLLQIISDGDLPLFCLMFSRLLKLTDPSQGIGALRDRGGDLFAMLLKGVGLSAPEVSALSTKSQVFRRNVGLSSIFEASDQIMAAFRSVLDVDAVARLKLYRLGL